MFLKRLCCSVPIGHDEAGNTPFLREVKSVGLQALLRKSFYFVGLRLFRVVRRRFFFSVFSPLSLPLLSGHWCGVYRGLISAW